MGLLVAPGVGEEEKPVALVRPEIEALAHLILPHQLSLAQQKDPCDKDTSEHWVTLPSEFQMQTHRGSWSRVQEATSSKTQVCQVHAG